MPPTAALPKRIIKASLLGLGTARSLGVDMHLPNQHARHPAIRSRTPSLIYARACLCNARTPRLTLVLLRDLCHYQETERLVADSPPGISAIPHEDNLRYFDVIIDGPGESPFEGGKFKLELFLPEEYPMGAPKVRCVLEDVLGMDHLADAVRTAF